LLQAFTPKEKLMRKSIAVLAAVAVFGIAGCSSMGYGSAVPAPPTKVADGVVTNAAGMTLYTFDKDAAGSGKSTCNGPCATSWPPLLAATDAKASGEYTIITRDDGARQWAYKGKPLYLWIKDAKPGDRTGDGFNNAWRVARS
jgi:predicted lipoprotein with Yx(FWY)xxD motif